MKRLYKSNDDKIIAGVCAGIAEYFDIDPTIVRIITFILSLTFGSGLIVYICLAIIMPSKPNY